MAKRGRPRKMENLFNAPSKQNVFTEGNKSPGILDDFAVRKAIDTQEGTITKVPVNNYDIVNKAYADTCGVTDHSALSNLNWLSAGHIMDADLDLNNNELLNAGTSSYSISTQNATLGAFLSEKLMFNQGATPQFSLQGWNSMGSYGLYIVNEVTSSNILSFTSGGKMITTGGLQLGGGSIIDTTGAISFGNEDLSTTGTISAGNIATTGDIQATTANLAGLDISNDGTKTTILGTAGDYNRIGDAGTTNHGLASNDDLMVTGKFEVDGNADFDGFANFRSRAVFGDAVASYYGSNSDMKLEYSTAQNPDTMVYWLDSTAKSLIFSLNSLAGRNLDHGAQADPTLIIHSSTDPNSDNTQWLSLTHDQTDGVIGVGTGALKMPATLKVGSTTLTEQNIIDLLALLE